MELMVHILQIGANNAAGPGQFWDGRMSQVYMVDGQGTWT